MLPYCFLPVGVAVIFAQLPINQFRSIGWYNAALGFVIIIAQFFLFKGESGCSKLRICNSSTWKSSNKLCPKKLSASWISSIAVSSRENMKCSNQLLNALHT